ncbi:MAG: hypothetical protein F4X64_11590 [Chloroflexi bacterium]|nr:hypothetical protein [Chloroflexota bacterium]
MPRDSFTAEVIQQLKWYVYRLIDPRNGETFYVGKGQGNRVFEHVKGAISSDADEVSDPKIARIKEIQATGLQVSHTIHRHGLATSAVAYQVEAALIDAYPGLANKQAGKGSRDYGCRHVEEIIAELEAEEFVVREPLMFIIINNRYYTHSVYDATRFAWPVSPKTAGDYNLVLASLRGLIVGAFRPNQPWIEATQANFPGLADTDIPDRWGFVGKEAEDVWDDYVGKRVPAIYRKKGARLPFRYCNPKDG